MFIVVTEEYYGGYLDGDDTRVFENKGTATEYSESVGNAQDLDTMILERDDLPKSDKVHLVITEEWYGGANKVKCFTNKSDADSYRAHLMPVGEYPPDSVTIEKQVE